MSSLGEMRFPWYRGLVNGSVKNLRKRRYRVWCNHQVYSLSLYRVNNHPKFAIKETIFSIDNQCGHTEWVDNVCVGGFQMTQLCVSVHVDVSLDSVYIP